MRSWSGKPIRRRRWTASRRRRRRCSSDLRRTRLRRGTSRVAGEAACAWTRVRPVARPPGERRLTGRHRRRRGRRRHCNGRFIHPKASTVSGRARHAGVRLRAGGRGWADGPGISLLVRELQPDPTGFSSFRRARQLRLPLAGPDRTQRGDQHVSVHLRRGDDRIRSWSWRRAALMARRLVQPDRARSSAHPGDGDAARRGAHLQGAAQSGIWHARLSLGGVRPFRPARPARASLNARSPRLSRSTPGNGRRSWR